jgi:2-polyprenyl-3-methyl-5-hydroxy-6-metoxy-1,4-benzoquinol methylase
MLNKRSNGLEIIDLGPAHYTEQEYADCLNKLDRIGRWLGGNRANLAALNRVAPPPTSILDVGCGGGHFTLLMAQHFPQAKVVGLELNPLANAYAKQLNSPKNVIFQWRKEPELTDLPRSYDVVIATLVCHHMNDETLIAFIKKCCTIAKKKVILNDLHRHPLA